jgi:glycosyltransferase involved in cell wall biosynthesis
MGAGMAAEVKVRVLEVLATLKRAGAERTAVTIATGLERSRFECEVVSLYDAFEDGFEDELARAGLKVHHLGKRPGFDSRMYPRLARVMREFRPDVVHTHSYVLRYVWPVASAKVVHTVHNLADREVDRAGRALHRWSMRRGARFVAISNEVARSFREVYGRQPAAVIFNGVDLPPGRREWRREQGFADDDVLIASVARLEPQKNPLALLDALPADPRCHLLLAGDGSLRDEVERRAGDRVHLLGVRGDVADVLAGSDIFALASDYEGLPVAVIEAMAAGLPVVATGVGGVPELVADGVTGLLVRPRDRQALRVALTALVRDPERRRKMGERGRERSRLFGASKMVDEYARLFAG